MGLVTSIGQNQESDVALLNTPDRCGLQLEELSLLRQLLHFANDLVAGEELHGFVQLSVIMGDRDRERERYRGRQREFIPSWKDLIPSRWEDLIPSASHASHASIVSRYGKSCSQFQGPPSVVGTTFNAAQI